MPYSSYTGEFYDSRYEKDLAEARAKRQVALEDASESMQRSTAAMEDWSQRSGERTTATAAALTQLRNRILHQD